MDTNQTSPMLILKKNSYSRQITLLYTNEDITIPISNQNRKITVPRYENKHYTLPP